MARQAKSAVFIAKNSFTCEIDGEVITVSKGDRVRGGHPLVAIHGDQFEDVSEHVKFEWETADDRAPVGRK